MTRAPGRNAEHCRAYRTRLRGAPASATRSPECRARLSEMRAEAATRARGLDDPARCCRILAAEEAFRDGRAEGPLQAIAARFGLEEEAFRAVVRRLRDALPVRSTPGATP